MPMSSETSSRLVRHLSARHHVLQYTPASLSICVVVCQCDCIPVFVCGWLTVSLLLHVGYRLRLETTRSRMYIWAPTRRNCWFDWLTAVTGYNQNAHMHTHVHSIIVIHLHKRAVSPKSLTCVSPCLFVTLLMCCMRLFCRSVLTSLKVDPVALQSSETSGRVKGVIITMKGNRS